MTDPIEKRRLKITDRALVEMKSMPPRQRLILETVSRAPFITGGNLIALCNDLVETFGSHEAAIAALEDGTAVIEGNKLQ